MSGMFDNYNHPSPGNPHHHPHHKPEPKPNVSSRPDKPYESYDENGDICGYWWYEGDTIVLEFAIEGEVTVDQEVIEVIDGVENSIIKPTTITAEEFVKDKTFTLDIFNFRGEVVLTADIPGSSIIQYAIDIEKAQLLTKGSYTLNLALWDGESFNKTIYSREDCNIIIK